MSTNSRRDFLRLVGALSAAGAFTGSLAACGPASTSPETSGDDKDLIEAGISYSLSTGFDPMTSSSATATAANLHVFESLVDLDPVTREPYTALAKAMPEKIGETVWRATLRDGATFHDGSPVTTEDVVFSFSRILDPANNSLFTQFLPFLSTVAAVDDKTVEFTLKYAFSLFPSRISVVRIVPKKIVEADQAGFDAKPVGSGPFKLIEATKEDKIVFEKFDAYNGPKPAKVKKMIWRLLSDPSARVSALESGRVHAIEDLPYIDVARVSQKLKVESVQSFGLLFLMFNCARQPFGDKRVRQALHYAIDYDKLIASAMAGNASAATSFLQSTHADYKPAKVAYKHDPEKAKGLLAAAGVTDLSLTLVMTNTGWVKDIAPFIKESWDAIGVQTTLDIGASGGQYKNKIDTGNYEVMAAPGDPSVFGNDVDLLMRWWYVGQWPEKRFNWSTTPEAKKVVELLDAAAKEADPAKQRATWQEAIDLLSEEVPLYPLLHRKLPTAWDDKALAGFRGLPTTGVSFLDVGRA